MKNYKFEKRGNIYRWTNKSVRVEFSEPHIQTRHETVELTNVKDIMYLYYNVDVYCKCYDRWKPHLHKYAYDFPALLSLIDLLNRCLNDDENNLSCRCSYMEDFYEIKHDMINDEQLYTLVIGCVPDGFYHTITKSITLEYLTKAEIEEFSKMVNAFLEYAMKSYSEKAKKREKFERQNKIIKNNKLYMFELDRDNNEYLDSMVIVGDKVRDLYVFVPTTDGKTYKEKEYSYLAIKKFDEENQIIYFDNGLSFKCSEIASLYVGEPKEKLHYDVPEIVRDFYEILSDDEKADFANHDVETLFTKYCWTIIGRSWMCRDEHNFVDKHPELLDINDSGNHERTFEVVKMVIRELKNMC